MKDDNLPLELGDFIPNPETKSFHYITFCYTIKMKLTTYELTLQAGVTKDMHTRLTLQARVISHVIKGQLL